VEVESYKAGVRRNNCESDALHEPFSVLMSRDLTVQQRQGNNDVGVYLFKGVEISKQSCKINDNLYDEHE
jgi:hypothetical protein